MTWSLHPQLDNDCMQLGVVDNFCHILLHKNASLPWFLLVPETDQLDLCDLDTETQTQLMGIATIIHQEIKQSLGCDRVNIGALGLVVPQLHLHIIGRNEGDATWPAPVWGKTLPPATYDVSQLEAMQSLLFGVFGDRFLRIS